MKIIIEIRNSPVTRFFVNLSDKALIDMVKKFINKGKYEKAIVEALTKGEGVREIQEDEFHLLATDMILTQKSVHYELM